MTPRDSNRLFFLTCANLFLIWVLEELRLGGVAHVLNPIWSV